MVATNLRLHNPHQTIKAPYLFNTTSIVTSNCDRDQYVWECLENIAQFKTLFGSRLLVKYVHGKRNKLSGTLVAAKIGHQVYIGWSLCNLKQDRFDKTIGLRKALDKIRSFVTSSEGNGPGKLPCSLQREFELFADRAERYFKVKVFGS